jgi:hypothetical protein
MSKPKWERRYYGMIHTTSASKEYREQRVVDENHKTLEELEDERKREKKHLKAYLKGKQWFTHGFETIKDELGIEHRRPQYFPVMQQLNPIKNE